MMAIRLSVFSVWVLFSMPLFAADGAPHNVEASVDASFFVEKIQPLFNARCISCHSCFESPCQLNLQTYIGVTRGANRLNAYDGARIEAVAPTRLFEDASSTQAWRKQGFYDVLAHGDKSLMWRFVKLAEKRQIYPREPVRENLTCVSGDKEMSLIEKWKPEFAMPYALPALSKEDQGHLQTWIRAGTPGTEEKLGLETLNAESKKIVRAWEDFLNAKDMKSRVLGRYLYEHFFLAHFYVPGDHKNFLRLMRSSTACEKAVTPVVARKPNDDPGVKSWHYCFSLDPAKVVVAKKHIPYEMSLGKLEWLKKNFSREEWSAESFPSFEPDISRNPFVTFKDIPAAARYRFLLEDARYHIMTFIKGPVCNGSVAVNVIQEQFYVLFMDPKSDVFVQDENFAKASLKQLELPGNFDAQQGLGKIFDDYATLTELRNAYRGSKMNVIKKMFPEGLSLEDVWGGDGNNPNALLTVLRHDDNAEVLFGAKGDVPKTVFLLDYSIFERLVYNLVVNFDVFGNVKHQALTRLYMDFIRMEAENNYLEFLPKKDRLPLKKRWYQGAFTLLKLNILNEDQFADVPTKVNFDSGADKHTQLLQKIIFERLSEKVRGPDDQINWKALRSVNPPKSPVEKQLRVLASKKVKDGALYAKLFPEFSIIAVERKGRIQDVYSIVRNREHLNISWMFAENFRLDPKTDSLIALKGLAGSYPQRIFVIDENEVPAFAGQIGKLARDRDFVAFFRKYGLSRRSPDFWIKFDAIQEVAMKHNSLDAGLLDLSRLVMEID